MRRPLLACTLLLTACAQYTTNAPLSHADDGSGYRFRPEGDPAANKLLVILTFSGGGTRAAAFSYGALVALDKVALPHDPGRTLLDETDLISSVSGGSFTAAYYGLHGKQIFQDFDAAVLDRNIQGDLAWQLLSPVNWWRLTSSTFDRIDLAAEYYDEEIFDHATFADLGGAGRRPFIALNATDMGAGARFEFTQDQFDLIGSDLASYPIGRAVAASSAFPVLLTPVRLLNHPQPDGYVRPEWITSGLEDAETSPSRFERATTANGYLATNKAGDKRRTYLHLLDGGLSDNIGLRGPMVQLTSNDTASSVLNMFNRGEVDRVVVIAVDAKTEPEHDWDHEESAPSDAEVLMTVCTTPMDNYSTDTIRLVEDHFAEQLQEQEERKAVEELIREQCHDPNFTLDPLHAAHLNFVHLSFDRVKDPELRERLLNMATSFRLSHGDVAVVIKAAQQLLDESPSFQALKDELAHGE